MLENVKNLCSHDEGRTFKVITESLNEMDYEVFFAILDGQNFIPQHRERIPKVGWICKLWYGVWRCNRKSVIGDTEAKRKSIKAGRRKNG